MQTAELSFKLRIARTPADLAAACSVRSEAYGRHMPDWRESLAHPDELDLAGDTAVLVCVDKVTGLAIGTARINVSFQRQLLIEQSVALPVSLLSASRAEITRLAILPGADAMAKLALMKAAFLFCTASQVRNLVIGARSVPLIRMYMQLGFDDVFGPSDMFPLAHAGNEPHRILSFNVTTAEQRWSAARHRLYGFMAETSHPDISLFSLAPALDIAAQDSHFGELAAA